MSLRVLLLTGGAGDEGDLVRSLNRPGGPTTLVRRCLDAGELLGGVTSGAADVVVVDVAVAGMGVALVHSLRQAGAVVVGYAFDRDQADRLRSYGADAVAMAAGQDDPARQVEQAVASALSGAGLDGSEPPSDPEPVGVLTAVWGPAGSPGRSTVAAALAAHLAGGEQRVLLIDGHLGAASLAEMCGLPPMPGLTALTRPAESGTLTPADLATTARPVPGLPRLGLLGGVTDPGRRGEPGTMAAVRILSAAVGAADHVVVDCGWDLDARSPGTALARACLDRCDHTLAVWAARPIGALRVAAGWPGLVSASRSRPVVVANQAGHPAAGRSASSQIRSVHQALTLAAGSSRDLETVAIPYLPEPLHRAERRGRLPEPGRTEGLTEAIAHLVAAMTAGTEETWRPATGGQPVARAG